jgi:hypothetical protein
MHQAHPAGDLRIVGVSDVGPIAFAKARKIAQLSGERGLAPEPAFLGNPATRLKALLR